MIRNVNHLSTDPDLGHLCDALRPHGNFGWRARTARDNASAGEAPMTLWAIRLADVRHVGLAASKATPEADAAGCIGAVP